MARPPLAFTATSRSCWLIDGRSWAECRVSYAIALALGLLEGLRYLLLLGPGVERRHGDPELLARRQRFGLLPPVAEERGDAVPTAHPKLCEPRREPVHPLLESGPGQLAVTVDHRTLVGMGGGVD